MAFLIQVNEGVKSVILPLGKAVILIGRDAKSNLYLDASGISKDHASIVFSNETYTLKDNGSTSGTIVNGVRVTEHTLAHDDLIQFGTYTFKVDLKNPIPVTTSVPENDVQLERAGHSYTRRVELEEISGHETAGPLQVVMTDTPKTLPEPLPATGFLASLSLQQRQNLSMRGLYRYARAGEVLIHEGQNSGRLMLLITGKWEARKEVTQTVLGQINPGDWVGEVNIFDPAGAMCSVVAVDPSEYWEITRDAFEKFINESRSTGSAILIALAATLGRRIRQSAGDLDKAVNAPPVVLPPKRSRFTPVFAAVAVVAIVLAIAFFFTGTADKNRLQTEKQQLIHDHVETEQEATESIQSLKTSLQQARASISKLGQEKEELTRRLNMALKAIESLKKSASIIQSAKSEASLPAEVPEPPAPQPADSSSSEVLAKAATLSGYPSKITITKKTSVSLIMDGRVFGSVVLPEGCELPVKGAEDDIVIVEFGDSSQRISKSNTNFAEALVAEAEAAQSHATPVPASAPVATNPKIAAPNPETPGSQGNEVKRGSDLSLEKVTSVLEDVKLLQTLDELRNMRSASTAEFSRFMRSLESKWKRASKESLSLMALEGGPEEYREILKKVIEASEMLDPARAQMFDAKLKEIDAAWLKLKTEEKIQNLTENPAS